MKTERLITFVICVVVVYLAAFLGSLFTTSAVNSEWYLSVRPAITPPAILFPIVWNILFFLIALSLYVSWYKSKDRTSVVIAFGVNLVLNVLWSLFYFKMQNPLYAFIEIIFLWLSIVYMLYTIRKIRLAFWMIVPYFVWVSFAAVLNYLSIK